jgi:hypothetical protein
MQTASVQLNANCLSASCTQRLPKLIPYSCSKPQDELSRKECTALLSLPAALLLPVALSASLAMLSLIHGDSLFEQPHEVELELLLDREGEVQVAKVELLVAHVETRLLHLGVVHLGGGASTKRGRRGRIEG